MLRRRQVIQQGKRGIKWINLKTKDTVTVQIFSTAEKKRKKPGYILTSNEDYSFFSDVNLQGL